MFMVEVLIPQELINTINQGVFLGESILNITRTPLLSKKEYIPCIETHRREPSLWGFMARWAEKRG